MALAKVTQLKNKQKQFQAQKILRMLLFHSKKLDNNLLLNTFYSTRKSINAKTF